MSYKRRVVLTTTGAVVTAALAGCSDNGNGDDNGNGHESAVEEYFDALEERDLETLNEYVAEDGELEEYDSTNYPESSEMETHDYELAEEDGDTVTYDYEITVNHAAGEDDFEAVLELRQVDGEWKVWDDGF